MAVGLWPAWGPSSPPSPGTYNLVGLAMYELPNMILATLLASAPKPTAAPTWPMPRTRRGRRELGLFSPTGKLGSEPYVAWLIQVKGYD